METKRRKSYILRFDKFCASAVPRKVCKNMEDQTQIQQEDQNEEEDFDIGYDDANKDAMDETVEEEKEEIIEEKPELDKNQVLLGILKDMKDNLESAINILGGVDIKTPGMSIKSSAKGDSKILEGVFTGDKMIGPDGKSYNVPPNYASKSKLVEGDILKLTVTQSGNFIYKQIGPIARKRLTGELIVDSERDEYWVASDIDKWRVLKASATYFKGESGDKAAFLIPQDGSSKWAAVENIIKEGASDDL